MTTLFATENHEWLLLDSVFGLDWAADDAIQTGLLPEHFDDSLAARLYEVIRERRSQGLPVNIDDFTPQDFAGIIAEQQARLVEKLAEARFETRSGVSAAYFANKVIESGLKRLHNLSARQMLDDIHRGMPWQEADGRHQKRTSELTASHGKQFKTFKDSAAELIDEVDNPKAATYGIRSGFRDLDHIIGGLGAGKLIVPAAVSSGGKTAFSVCVGNNVAKAGGLVGFISAEMKLRELHQRIACCEASVDSMKLRANRLTDDEKARYKTCVLQATKLPFLVVDDCRNLDTLIPRFRTMHRKRPFSLLIADYTQLLHLVADKGANREQRVSEVAATLKSLAMELDVPVVSPSQLNKEAERRDGPPNINDLRESAAIGHTADVVLFIKPPENGGEGTAEVYVGKNRGGPKDKRILLTWRPQFTRFENHVFENSFSL